MIINLNLAFFKGCIFSVYNRLLLSSEVRGLTFQTSCLVLLLLFFISPSIYAEKSAEAITLQLKWKHQFQFAGYYAALEKGFYSEVGLGVTIQEHQGDRSPADVLIAGDAQYVVAGADILIHRANGLPVVALATIFQHSPYAFLVRADSGIKRIEDLAGKRIMMGTGVQDASLQAALRSSGLKKGDYTLLETSFSPLSLIEGETDAFNAYITDQGFILQEAGLEPLYLLPKQSHSHY